MDADGYHNLKYVVHVSMTLLGLLNCIWMKEGTERVIKYHKKYYLTSNMLRNDISPYIP